MLLVGKKIVINYYQLFHYLVQDQGLATNQILNYPLNKIINRDLVHYIITFLKIKPGLL